VASANDGYIQLASAETISNTTDYANSIYVKRATGTGTVYIKDCNNAETEITTTTAWQRFDVTSESTSTSGQIGIKLATSGDEVYIYGADMEAGSYPTSYIRSEAGGTVTRSADAVTGAGDATTFASVNSSGVLYVEIAAHADDLVSKVISVSDGTSDNRFLLFYDGAASNKIRAFGRVNSVDQFDFNTTSYSIDENHKIALRWAENDFSLWIDGTEVKTDISGSTWGSYPLTTLHLTNYGGAGEPFYGNTKQIAVYNYLTDEQMISLTTP